MGIMEITNVESRKLTSIVRVSAIVLGVLVGLGVPYVAEVYSRRQPINRDHRAQPAGFDSVGDR
jgi:predicted membrane-bound spermidine synthase